MYKKMISLTAIMAMIVTLVMPARAYADETQAESQPVLKYSVLMSGASGGRKQTMENMWVSQRIKMLKYPN